MSRQGHRSLEEYPQHLETYSELAASASIAGSGVQRDAINAPVRQSIVVQGELTTSTGVLS